MLVRISGRVQPIFIGDGGRRVFHDFMPRADAVHAIVRVYNARPRDTLARYGSNLPHHELIYKRSGASVTCFGEHTIDLTQGTVLLLPQGPIMGEYTVQAQEPGEAIDILFDTTAPFPTAPRFIHLQEGHRIATLFDKAHATWIQGGVAQQTRALSVLYGLFAELAEWGERRYLPSTQEAILVPAMAYLAAHGMEASFSYKAMGEAAGVSYSYFKRIFLKRYGMPPSRYHTLQRMALAKELLERAEPTVTQVAETLGYESVHYFSRAFKQETGESPSAYRKRMR